MIASAGSWVPTSPLASTTVADDDEAPAQPASRSPPRRSDVPTRARRAVFFSAGTAQALARRIIDQEIAGSEAETTEPSSAAVSFATGSTEVSSSAVACHMWSSLE